MDAQNHQLHYLFNPCILQYGCWLIILTSSKLYLKSFLLICFTIICISNLMFQLLILESNEKKYMALLVDSHSLACKIKCKPQVGKLWHETFPTRIEIISATKHLNQTKQWHKWGKCNILNMKCTWFNTPMSQVHRSEKWIRINYLLK